MGSKSWSVCPIRAFPAKCIITLSYWTHSEVTKMKCCEYTLWSLSYKIYSFCFCARSAILLLQIFFLSGSKRIYLTEGYEIDIMFRRTFIFLSKIYKTITKPFLKQHFQGFKLTFLNWSIVMWKQYEGYTILCLHKILQLMVLWEAP